MLSLVEFGVSLSEVAAMSLNEVAFWVAELEAYCERNLD